jgi:endonuclease YncB( thermonuclease family)
VVDRSQGPGRARRARRDLRQAALALGLVAIGVACSSAEVETVSREPATVARIGDGDSLELRSGARIRLLQIDAPELGEGECHARESLRVLERLVPSGSRVSLQSDPELDDADRYGRLLRYVDTDGVNVNVELVRRGAATPYFRGGEQGLHADELLAAVERARRSRAGMWGACRVSWRSDRLVTTRPR